MFDIVIIGGGAAGLGVAQSIYKRQKNLKIAIAEPASQHFYQPAWTLAGAGETDISQNVKPMDKVMPHFVKWIKSAAMVFDPDNNCITLENKDVLHYRALIVCPGLCLNWSAIEGLEEALGKNGVTSNYRSDLAPYTWQMVQQLKNGTALFTQPAMPVKCAGAPQKAVYLSCFHWEKHQVLKNIKVQFHHAGTTLFGVEYFVPILKQYMDRYRVDLNFSSTLTKVDGANKIATFSHTDLNGDIISTEIAFDMLHIVPPQSAHPFIACSPLANAAGWVDVNASTLQHIRYPNIFSLGDAASSPNAKTAAAIRKQAPVVAINIIRYLAGLNLTAQYNGYGGCPLTVENGKIVLAEFAYQGELDPTFKCLTPNIPRRFNWFIKRYILAIVYWHGLLKGREWLVKTKQ
ncbi:NAD(P)/FAD-dependent oxidoreductase [Iodobacter sp. HSC-16F04]|uniref:NAD(P)/FAD-dependent oxidoreductase n=1 Tax=Iodobacter violaceini TaxID=3044271 RepID=A0ABX0KKX1_9NEIS|nr:FAD/NAD(P)-binding oxidoreductase [Iodobacter violacea]NHQ84725.1 NAD(P)/FAD-dependent oxidoreductase [Iodobacter violacea]